MLNEFFTVLFKLVKLVDWLLGHIVATQDNFSFLVFQITGLAFSSINSDYIYVQGVDYEVITFEYLVHWSFSS